MNRQGLNQNSTRKRPNLARVLRNCPNCGGKMETGLLNAPRGIDWLAPAYTETLLGIWHWRMPKLQAQRCKKCQLVAFLYGNKKGEEEE